jgi:hypothetical protein
MKKFNRSSMTGMTTAAIKAAAAVTAMRGTSVVAGMMMAGVAGIRAALAAEQNGSVVRIPTAGAILRAGANFKKQDQGDDHGGQAHQDNRQSDMIHTSSLAESLYFFNRLGKRNQSSIFFCPHL